MIDTIMEKTAFPKAWNTVPTIIQNHAMRKCTPIILSAGTPILSISSEALNIPRSTCGMKLKARQSNKEQAECCYQTDLYCLNHTLSVLCTVVEGDDRCDSVVQSEYRHKEEALQFEINTENSSGSR